MAEPRQSTGTALQWTGAALPLPASLKLVLALLLLGSFVVKVGVFAWQPNTSYADVTMQYLEQAHRLLYGQGLVTWEFAVGARSWLVPGLIAPGMKLAELLGGGPQQQVLAAAAVSSLFSLLVVVPCFLWGWRFVGTVGAVVCGALGAFWFESVYYAGHPLQDTFGTFFLIPGVYLAYPNGPERDFRRLLAAGFLLGLAVAFRMQLGPMAAIAALGVARLHPLRYVALGLGGVAGMAILGVLDWITWGVPFNSIIQYVKYQGSSIGETGPGKFGFVPWYSYPGWILAYYSGAFALLVVTALVGLRRLPLLLVIAVFNVLVLELVAMKFPRYIYPGVPLVLVLCGIGGSELALRLWGGKIRTPVLAAYGFLFVVVTSGLLGAFGYFASHWVLGRGTILATRQVNADPAACGLAIAPASAWWLSGGYVFLDRRIPLYGVDAEDAGARAQSAGFNYILSTRETPAETLQSFGTLGYEQLACYANGTRGPACLWRRPGTCTPGAAQILKASLPDWLDVPNDPAR
ncbi:MAG: hypothetical protein B7Z15_09065 [Rhizobiales bacterium 32-66-8]|nr:MAG: hypothetical protein B7Z15_09065 [Rhizobiales bacterium 32-66-8]